jgi:hypothetical protein
MGSSNVVSETDPSANFLRMTVFSGDFFVFVDVGSAPVAEGGMIWGKYKIGSRVDARGKRYHD